jgi:hypothetical protein
MFNSFNVENNSSTRTDWVYLIKNKIFNSNVVREIKEVNRDGISCVEVIFLSGGFESVIYQATLFDVEVIRLDDGFRFKLQLQGKEVRD